MPGELQRLVLDLVRDVVGDVIEEEYSPAWLRRPGRDECGSRWPLIQEVYYQLTQGMVLPTVMPLRERRRIDGLCTISGRKPFIIEFDESQHFGPARLLTLSHYPADISVRFSIQVWSDHCKRTKKQPGGGFARPCPPLFPHTGGRHLQRAFRDMLADVLPPLHGYEPTLRIAHFEVKPWLGHEGDRIRMRDLLRSKGLTC